MDKNLKAIFLWNWLNLHHKPANNFSNVFLNIHVLHPFMSSVFLVIINCKIREIAFKFKTLISCVMFCFSYSVSICSISMPLHLHSTLEPLGIEAHLDTLGTERCIPPNKYFHGLCPSYIVPCICPKILRLSPIKLQAILCRKTEEGCQY